MTYERYQNGAPATNGGPSSSDIQSDVVEIRGELSKTLGELTEKLAPKELLSQLTSIFKDGGGARMLKSLSRSIERNPIPVVMIAGGIGMLVYQEVQSRKPAPPPRAGELPEGLDGARSPELEASSDSSGMRELASATRASAGELAGRARDGAREMGQRASGLATRAAQTTRDAAHKGQELVREQPLVVAGLGLALGAAIAGTAPLSRREEQLIGEPAGELIGELEQRANQIKDRVEQGVQAVGEATKQALTEDQGGREESQDQGQGTQSEPR